MSIVELIARRSTSDPSSFSLPDLLAEEVMTRVQGGPRIREHALISEFLAAELVRDRVDGARDYVQTLLDHGISEEKVLARYVSGAASVLGEAWEGDSLSFAEVTHAMGHLMEIARGIMSAPPPQPYFRPNRTRVLLARTPGEHHTLGLLLVAQQMRRRGWLVRLDISGDVAAITTALNGQEFDMVGFTASGDGRIPALSSAIRLVRRLQPGSTVVVGGPVGIDDPEFPARVDADVSVGRDTMAVESLIRMFRLETG